ncbi:MAG: adenosylmethionine decarboxylase [Myxococcales bacterium]|nr:adenosylmethionine decarboxylase [Myxococcales bacterium]
MSFLGTQILIELVGCPRERLDDVEAVRGALLSAADLGGLTVVNDVIHKFNPHGVSGVVVIAESHIAIHTWPEHGYASLDIYTCGDETKGKLAADYLVGLFEAQHHTMQVLRRGWVRGHHGMAEPILEMTSLPEDFEAARVPAR